MDLIVTIQGLQIISSDIWYKNFWYHTKGWCHFDTTFLYINILFCIICLIIFFIIIMIIHYNKIVSIVCVIYKMKILKKEKKGFLTTESWGRWNNHMIT